ncbi:type II toxin-antitoxin system RelE/ParE family toxin [Myroides odoratimimus]|uniref:type II toxin-antitoxin system RelE/ParE family toxin n=1 Tax=Myroides odoratimimus TaxID=76832 RepID=UPI0025822CB0|nr:type II toxin-antitoxin system RelE/ParE family toxin [Myroides odoratimimus]
MIKSFRKKELKSFWEEEVTKGLPPKCISRIAKILNLINQINTINDLGSFVTSSYRVHKLKSPPFIGYYSMDVTGNYRIVFELIDGDVYNIDFLDTH